MAVETTVGPEPCAVLSMRGSESRAEEAVDRANAQLADFQQIRRWLLWPDPDLPRTPTGKVRRKAVAEWVVERSVETASTSVNGSHAKAHGGDWLYTLVAEIAGEQPVGEDHLRLSEDFHLDSLGRVQLAAALEERLTDAPGEGAVDAAQTLGDLRRLVRAVEDHVVSSVPVRITKLLSGSHTQDHLKHPADSLATNPTHTSSPGSGPCTGGSDRIGNAVSVNEPPFPTAADQRADYQYVRWPWWAPARWIRIAFLELIAQPLIWFLAKPNVSRPQNPASGEPMLIICNHVTAYDGALVEYALPGRMRRRVAAAMLGEMLEDFRHFRDPVTQRFMLFGPAAYWLVTALYNVFPLPRRRDFQRSFAHAGEAMDRGYNVLVFPEGTRSDSGELAPFRPGIGLLAKQTLAPVLPVAILGLGELKARGHGWFRSGQIEIRVGEPLRFGPLESETAITEMLHAKVAELMKRQP